MTAARVVRSRTPVLKSISKREETILQRAREESRNFDNPLFAEMYVTALERRIRNNDSALYTYLQHLEQAPVSIEVFIDDEEFLGATDLTLWPEVRKAIIEINQNWWKGLDHGANVEAILSGATGTGKCLAKGTPVLLYDGRTVPVEQVQVGDRLMGPDSTPRTVLSLASGREEMFKVTPTKGDSYTVNRSHILSLKVTSMGLSRGRERAVVDSKRRHYWAGDIVDISVEDYLASSKTFKHVTKGWRTGVEFSKQAKLPVDPYYLGLWVGDGSADNCSVTTNDSEIRAYLLAHARGLGMHLRNHASVGKCATYATVATVRGSPSKLLVSMHRLGLARGRKFIPRQYLTASVEDRLALLAGIVDSDGHLSCGGYEVTTKSDTLRDDYLYLARSLGYAAYSTTAHKTCQTGGGGSYHRVFISGDIAQVPVLLPRKQASQRTQSKDVLLTGIRVESVGEGEYFGFEIDGDRRFLLGDFTVTHNTSICEVTTLYHLHVLACLKQPQTLYGLPKTTSIIFPIMAAKPHVTKKVVYQPIRKMIEDIPWFQKHLQMDKLIESEVYFKEKNIRIVVGGADEDSILGEAVIGGIIDEINFMNVVLKSKKSVVTSGRVGIYDQAQSIYEAMTRRKKSRFITQGPQIGVVLVSSSTRYKGDFTDKRKKHVEMHNEKNVYIYNKAQYQVWPQDRYCGETFRLMVGNEVLNDTRVLNDGEQVPEGTLVLDVPIEYKGDFLKNPHDSLRDIVGQSTSSVSPFFRRRFKILECIQAGADEGLKSFLIKDNVVLGTDGMPQVKHGHYCMNPSRPRYVHIDLSLNSDSCGIAMLRFDGLRKVERDGGFIEMLPECSVELAVSIKPDAQNEIQIADVRTWVKQLRDVFGYPIKVVTYDGIMGIESRQQWKKEGMKTGYVSVDKTSTPYKQLRDGITDIRVKMFENDVLTNELFELEYDTVKDKIDHPVHSSKDVADAVCGAYTTLLERRSSWMAAASDDNQHVQNERRDFADRFEEERFS